MGAVSDMEIQMWDLFLQGFTLGQIGEILDIDDHAWIFTTIVNRLPEHHRMLKEKKGQK